MKNYFLNLQSTIKVAFNSYCREVYVYLQGKWRMEVVENGGGVSPTIFLFYVTLNRKAYLYFLPLKVLLLLDLPRVYMKAVLGFI